MPAAPINKIHAFLRTDKEQRHDAATAEKLFEHAQIEDWQSLGPQYWWGARNMLRVMKRLPHIPGLASTMTQRTAFLNRVAADHVAFGLQQLAPAEVVVTDRLHGHNLCTLIGKISNFITAWGTDGTTRVARNYDEAARAGHGAA